jgi:CysZ protein
MSLFSYFCRVKAILFQLKTGFMAYFLSFAFIAKHALWLYFLIPAVLSFALWWSGDIALRDLRTFSFGDLPAKDFEFEILFAGLKAIFVFISLKLNKYLVMILLSPVLTRLSEKTERLLTGKKNKLTWLQFFTNLFRAIQIAIRNMVIQMLIIAAWLVLTLIIPVLAEASGVVIFMVGFYFYGFFFMDYVSERLGYGLDESVSFIRKNWLIAFCLGGIFAGLFSIPYAGVVVAPITASIAATLAVHRVVDPDSSSKNSPSSGSGD